MQYATLEDELWYVVFTDVETDLQGEGPVLIPCSTDIAEQVPGFPWIGADPGEGLMFVSVEEEVEGGFEVVEHQIFPFSEGRVFFVSWEGESAIVQLPLFPGLHGNAEEEVQRLARREEIREFLGR